MDDEKKIDDIVSMIDQFMAGNGGHLNISVDANNSDLQKNIQTTNTIECASGDLACQIPTLHSGLDGKE